MTSHITEDFCRRFREYMTKAKDLNANDSEPTDLSNNSAALYFSIFKSALRRAIEAKIIFTNPAEQIKPISVKETQRNFLSLTELQALAGAECNMADLKRAALFSALTGLRYSDVATLVWSEVYADQEQYSLRFTQQKTANVETLPISETRNG